LLTVNYEIFKIKEGDKFLDVGCGEGRHSFEASSRLNYGGDGGLVCALDLDNLSLRKTHYVLHYMESQNDGTKNWLVLMGDSLRLPFRDASFDKIICSEVMEHVPDPDQGIAEMVRVLKPGGLMAVTVPTYIPEKICWMIDEDYYNRPGCHVRIFTTKKLIAILRRHKLRVYGIRFEHAFHSTYWIMRCCFGLMNEKARIPAMYRKHLLDRQIITRSKFAAGMERIFNFIHPKSIVVYTVKPRE